MKHQGLQWMRQVVAGMEGFSHVLKKNNRKTLADLKDGIEKGDGERLRFLLHRLKGTAHILESERVMASIVHFEGVLCGDLQSVSVERALNRIETELGALEGKVECLVKENRGIQ